MRGSRAFEMSMNRAASNLWGARSLVTRLERVGTGARWAAAEAPQTPHSRLSRRPHEDSALERSVKDFWLKFVWQIREEFYHNKTPSLARSHARTTLSLTGHGTDWRALALTQLHHLSRQSDSCEGGTRSPAARNRRGRSTQICRVTSLSRPPLPPLTIMT